MSYLCMTKITFRYACDCCRIDFLIAVYDHICIACQQKLKINVQEYLIYISGVNVCFKGWERRKSSCYLFETKRRLTWSKALVCLNICVFHLCTRKLLVFCLIISRLYNLHKPGCCQAIDEFHRNMINTVAIIKISEWLTAYADYWIVI